MSPLSERFLVHQGGVEDSSVAEAPSEGHHCGIPFKPTLFGHRRRSTTRPDSLGCLEALTVTELLQFGYVLSATWEREVLYNSSIQIQEDRWFKTADRQPKTRPARRRSVCAPCTRWRMIYGICLRTHPDD
jgi:hypothetical protein